MATLNFHNALMEHLPEGVHVWGTHQLIFALTAAANAPVATNSVLGDLTPISYTNLSSRNVTTSSSSQTSGTYSLVTTDLVLTASGGAVAAFRYLDLYNDTPTSPADPLIGWYDYGSALTLADTETLTIDFGASTITLAAA
jgi:hypothetical protein